MIGSNRALLSLVLDNIACLKIACIFKFEQRVKFNLGRRRHYPREIT